MKRKVGAAVLALVLLGTAGCTGVFGAENGAAEIGSEEGSQGETFVYVESSGGQLPEGTEITVEHTLSEMDTVSGTLDRPANEGTRVYVGGPLGTESASDFRHGMPPANSIVPPNVEVELTVTVDTGEQTVTETVTVDG